MDVLVFCSTFKIVSWDRTFDHLPTVHSNTFVFIIFLLHCYYSCVKQSNSNFLPQKVSVIGVKSCFISM